MALRHVRPQQSGDRRPCGPAGEARWATTRWIPRGRTSASSWCGVRSGRANPSSRPIRAAGAESTSGSLSASSHLYGGGRSGTSPVEGAVSDGPLPIESAAPSGSPRSSTVVPVLSASQRRRAECPSSGPGCHASVSTGCVDCRVKPSSHPRTATSTSPGDDATATVTSSAGVPAVTSPGLRSLALNSPASSSQTRMSSAAVGGSTTSSLSSGSAPRRSARPQRTA